MRTRNVVLTDRYDRLIDNLVKAGRYQNASEVMRDGLRLVEAQELQAAERLKHLRAAVRVGIEQLDAGQGVEIKTLDELLKIMTPSPRPSRNQSKRRRP
ncbi:MAG: type II toxin-antitoxin system ParD family antitoxin [Alphaproteobacteria bacterium]|nr:type II toxin-antitoxin system ParD family antitoxin [Alphaproteobacteria bacterium]